MPEWHEIFVPNTPILEIVLRGTLVFFSVTVLMRVAGQRESGALGLTDLLVVVLIAEAVAEAMSGGYRSVPEGVILAATIVAWSVALDAVAYKVPALRALLKGKRRPVIERGRVNGRVMRREFLNREELEAQLRLQGVRDIDDVDVAYLEPNGMISVFRKDDRDTRPAPHPHAG